MGAECMSIHMAMIAMARRVRTTPQIVIVNRLAMQSRRVFLVCVCCLFSIATIDLASAADYSPQGVPNGGGRVCVERFEDNGSLNIWPVRVEFGSEVESELVGGTAICVYLPEGKYVLTLQWDGSDGKKLNGGSVEIDLVHRNMTEIAICNLNTSGTGNADWIGGWILAPKDEAMRRCQIPH